MPKDYVRILFQAWRHLWQAVIPLLSQNDTSDKYAREFTIEHFQLLRREH